MYPPQSVAGFSNAGMTYAPLASGIDPARRFPTEGLPFAGTPMGSTAGMLAMQPMQRLFGEVGSVPMGVGHDQNVYDRLRMQQYTNMQMQVMQQAAANDRNNYVKTFRGLAAITGTPYGAEQRRAAQSLGSMAAVGSPFFAEMMPEFLDQMGGTAGSATVMARRMIDAGRYRTDAVTGRMGMSAESVGASAGGLYGSLYSHDYMPRMGGISAGQVGSMFNEMQMRGMVYNGASERGFGGFRGDDPRSGVMRALGEMGTSDLQAAAKSTGVDFFKRDGLNAGDLDKLNLDPRVAEKMRSFDTSRIRRSIESYTGLINSMKDLFGDAGRSNAPIPELVGAIEAMTMKGLGQLDPTRAAASIRQTYNLAKQSGVTLQTVQALQGDAANRASALGIESDFAVTATQGGLAYGGAYRSTGAGAYRSWGGMNSDQVQQLDQNLRLHASTSNTANRIAVAHRLAASSGGFDPASEAGQYMAALQTGQTTFNGRSVAVDDREFVRMMTGAGKGITEGDITTMLGQSGANREMIAKHDIGGYVRKMQGTVELQPFIGRQLEQTLGSTLRGQLGTAGASDAAAAISQKVTAKMFALSAEEFHDPGRRNAAIAKLIDAELGSAGVAVGGSREERLRMFGMAAEQFIGASDTAIAQVYPMFGQVGGTGNVFRLNNPVTMAAAETDAMRARHTGDMQTAMQPLGRGSVLARAVDALKGLKPGDSALKAVAETMGGVRQDDINRALLPGLQRVEAKRRELEAAQSDAERSSDPTTRSNALARAEKIRRELVGETTDLAKIGERFGLLTADTLGHSDIVSAVGADGDFAAAQRDIVGLRGGFGHQVTAAELKDYNPGTLTDTDKVAIEMGRRQREVESIRGWLDGPAGGELAEGYKKSFESWRTKARGISQTAGMSDQALSRYALQMMQNSVDNVDVRDAAGNTIADDGDRMAVIRSRRRGTARRADADAIKAVRNEYPQITEGEAKDLANAKLRAKRLGVLDSEISEFKSKNPGFEGPVGHTNAIDAILESRADEQYADGSPEELFGRQKAHNALMESSFWGKDEGALYRDVVDAQMNTAADTAGKLIAGPQMVRRLGSRAVEYSETLRKDNQRMRTLAHLYAGGDVAKLTAGQFTGLDMSKPGARDAAKRVREEMAAINGRRTGIYDELSGTDGLGGRHYELGSEYNARKQVLDEEVAAGRMSRADADKLLGQTVSDGKMKEVRELQRTIGSEMNARDLLGISRDKKDLSDIELAGIAGIRFGAGSVDESRLIFGRDKWDGLDVSAREAAMAQLRKGFGGDDKAAAAYLGLDLGEASKDPTGSLFRRIRAASEGLTSEKHIDQLLGGAPLDPAMLSQYTKNRAAVRTGLYDVKYAREMAGLGADGMSATMQQKVDHYMQVAGNRGEALRLMGKRPGDVLNDDEKRMLDSLSYGVGAARMFSSEDELAILGGDHASMLKIANQYGVDVEDVARAAEVMKLQGKRQQDAAAKDASAPIDISRDILKGFGFNVGDSPDQTQMRFAALLGTEKGRGLGIALRDSQNVLLGAASKIGPGGAKGIDAMASEYFKALKGTDPKAMADFRGRYGLGDEASFDEFSKALQFQKELGFMQVGPERGGYRTKTGADEFVKIGEALLRKEDGIADGREPGSGGKMEITGSVRIDGDRLWFQDTAGRAYVPGAP